MTAAVDAAGLDAGRARAWTFIRLVDVRLWALATGLPDEAARVGALLPAFR